MGKLVENFNEIIERKNNTIFADGRTKSKTVLIFYNEEIFKVCLLFKIADKDLV